MKTNRMYGEYAHLWPLISDPEEYTEEAGYWRDALREFLGPGRHHVLELGVGGGHNLSHLTAEFEATAVDMSAEMLAHSEKLNGSVEHHLGDMRTVRLGRRFDAVLIHDAIGYMTTETDLLAAFVTAREHLKPGGVLVTAPDYYVETFDGPYVSNNTRKAGSVELTYVEYDTDPDPHDSTIDTVFVYFLTEDGKFRVELDRHVTGLFTIDTWQRLLGEAGFVTQRRPYPVTEDPRSDFLWVGVCQNVG
jgi:SAM-dependent methyltransferase